LVIGDEDEFLTPPSPALTVSYQFFFFLSFLSALLSALFY